MLRIYKRGHGFVRDHHLASEAFCEADFMFHNWKYQEVGEKDWKSPFNKNLDPSKCGNGLEGWDYRPEMMKKCYQIREMLSGFEKNAGKNYPQVARVLPHLQAPDVGLCYPYCDENV